MGKSSVGNMSVRAAFDFQAIFKSKRGEGGRLSPQKGRRRVGGGRVWKRASNARALK